MAYNILVVDDEPDIREFLRNLLEDEGYRVREAENGIAAMEQVRKEKPDLVLLDLQMPEETGTGFYRKLHNSKDFGNLPVIIISGLAGRNLAVSKSVIVFDKPIDEEGLLDAIREILA
jgi:CheY-like chemotaxis protein